MTQPVHLYEYRMHTTFISPCYNTCEVGEPFISSDPVFPVQERGSGV